MSGGTVLQFPGIPLPVVEPSKPTAKRYASAQRSWERYVSERGASVHDATDEVLLGWLTERLRNYPTRTNAMVSLSAIRALQRRALADGEIGIPYKSGARPRLQAWLATYLGEQPPKRQAPALTLEHLFRLVRHTLAANEPRRGVDVTQAVTMSLRDAALFCVGWWGCLRADDLAHIRWENVREAGEGLEVDLRKSKTGQATVALARREDMRPCCPVESLGRLYRWSEAHGLLDRAPFPHPITISTIVKRRSAAAGLATQYRGHSLRAGFATECARQGIDDRLVQRHGRWTSAETHAMYVRAGTLWADTPTRLIGLPT